MIWKNLSLKNRLRLIAWAVLLAGLCGAMMIYLTAKDDARESGGYDIVNGEVYSSDPEHSKKYVRNLELYGGKANVMADELDRWFDSLWQGKSLATTVAWLTVLTSAGIFLFAHQISSGIKPDSGDH